jgi:hypothetical protein
MAGNSGSDGTKGPPEWLLSAVERRYAAALSDIDRGVAQHAKQHAKKRVLEEVECIFDELTAQEKERLERCGSGTRELSMPVFLQQRCSSRFGRVPGVYGRHLWELLLNAESARRKRLHPSVELFCAFADKSLSSSDLLIFVFARQNLLSSLRSVASASTTLPDALVSKRSCHDTIRSAFPSCSNSLLPLLLRQVVDEHLPTFDGAHAADGANRETVCVSAYDFLSSFMMACNHAANQHCAHGRIRATLSEPCATADAPTKGDGSCDPSGSEPNAISHAQERCDGHALEGDSATCARSLGDHHADYVKAEAMSERFNGNHAHAIEMRPGNDLTQYTETHAALEQLHEPLRRACRDYAHGVGLDNNGRTERTTFENAQEELRNLFLRVHARKSIPYTDSLEAVLLDITQRVQAGEELSAYEAYAVCRRILSTDPVKSVLREWLVSALWRE